MARCSAGADGSRARAGRGRRRGRSVPPIGSIERRARPRWPAPPPAERIEAGVDGQSVEPGVEPVRVAQAREVAPGSDVRLLDRVAREIRVPKDEAGGGVQPRDGRADEHGEGVMIAPPCPFDEFPLVHSHPS